MDKVKFDLVTIANGEVIACVPEAEEHAYSQAADDARDQARHLALVIAYGERLTSEAEAAEADRTGDDKLPLLDADAFARAYSKHFARFFCEWFPPALAKERESTETAAEMWQRACALQKQFLKR